MTPRRRKPENAGLPKRWRIVRGKVYYQVPPGQESQWDGKKTFPLGATITDAYEVWAKRLKSIDKTTTVDELLDQYSQRVTPTRSPRTRVNHRRAFPYLRKFFGPAPVDGGVKPKHCYQYVEWRGAQTAAQRELEVLSHAFTKAVEWGDVDKHPFKGQVRFEADQTGEKAPPRYVQDWELAEVMKLKPRFKRGSVRMVQAYIRLKMVMKGLRMTDLLLLQPGRHFARDFSGDGIRVLISKTRTSTGKEVLFKWTPERIDAIKACLAARPKDIAPWLFCNRAGECYVDENMEAKDFGHVWQSFMRRALRETALKVRFKERDLRAKIGSDAETIQEAQRVLSHADSRVTVKHYRRKAEVFE
jgi:hypothetical protein